MADLLDNFTPAIARCHRHEIPVVDAAGRVLSQGAAVITRRGRMAGSVIHLFGFADFHRPECEVAFPSETGSVIYTFDSRLTGGCWRFDSLLVAEGGKGS